MKITVKRWIDRWNAFWFPTTTTRNLAIARIIAVAAQLFWFFPSLNDQLDLLKNNSEFINPQLLIRGISAIVPREVFFTPSAFTVLYWVTFAAGILALVGLFTRASLFVFALGIWILVAHLYSYADVHHEATVFAIFLLSLALSPSGESLSLDALLRRRRGRLVDTAMWPLKLAHVLLALTYFSTGISKVIVGGLQWINGYTLQDYVFTDAMARGFPLGIWLAQQHTVAILLSVFTVLFELFFFVSLILPWTAPFFFIGGLLFQIGLYATAGHDFFPHMVLLFLLLLFNTPEWWRAWLNKHLGAHLSLWRRQEPVQQPL